MRQLAVLAIIALAEQTAFNSISPYLPEMVQSFPEVKLGQEGLYVGLIASSFALAQFATNFFWGSLSDRIGRKPVILMGTVFTIACFVAFGFCRTLWQTILVQVFMGLLNGNQGLISTCLGEITDRSNQSQAFTYLPVLYGLGGITGPAVGGLLVLPYNPFDKGEPNPFPYLLPNIFSAVVLVVDLIITVMFLEESLEEAKDLPPLGERIGSLFTWLWQFTGSSHRPTYLRHFRARKKSYESNRSAAPSRTPILISEENDDRLSAKAVLNRDTILLLATYFIFQLSNVAYNSLYPIFAEAKPPAGRGLSTEEIGLSLAFAGVVTIVFQVGIFSTIRDKLGNRSSYRVSLAGFVISFLIMPFVGYRDGSGFGQGKIWIWIELGVALTIKTVAAIGGLASSLLLVCWTSLFLAPILLALTYFQITNSAPSHSVLGKLNGLAQTLSAAGRAVGPFISGGIFSAATKIQLKGEALAFGLFGGIAFLGFIMSLGIKSKSLEGDADIDDGDDDEEEQISATREEGDGEGGEEQPLLRR
jgi:MFS family permease